MNVGMLWFDNNPKDALDAKVERAASYYRAKYGRTPTLCFVHPSMLPPGSVPDGQKPEGGASKPGLMAAGVELRPNPSVRPNHFWIGVNGVG